MHSTRYYGGWAAPNIYFLGVAGVVRFGNIRIGGVSGIYNGRHYKSGCLVVLYRWFKLWVCVGITLLSVE